MKSLSGKVGVIELIILGYCYLVVNIANAQSTLALQEKCAEGAKKYFADHIEKGRAINNNISYHSDELCISVLTYSSHYSKKSDKCFIRIEHRLTSKREYIKIDPTFYTNIHSIYVYNVFGEEGKEYGDYFETRNSKTMKVISLSCTVGSKACNSLAEFEALIKPYVEE